MSTTSGTVGGRNFLIAPMPWESPMSKQEMRTISQPASSMPRISFLVASVSLVAVVVSDCTQMGWFPPTTSFPTGTSRVLCRTIMPSSYIGQIEPAREGRRSPERRVLEPAPHDDQVLLPVGLDVFAKVWRDSRLFRGVRPIIHRLGDVEAPRRLVPLGRLIELGGVDHDVLGETGRLVADDFPPTGFLPANEIFHVVVRHGAEDFPLVVRPREVPLVRPLPVVAVVGLPHEAARQQGASEQGDHERFHGHYSMRTVADMQSFNNMFRRAR